MDKFDIKAVKLENNVKSVINSKSTIIWWEEKCQKSPFLVKNEENKKICLSYVARRGVGKKEACVLMHGLLMQ